VGRIKAVADTNILVSSIFWSGNPYQIIQKGINQEVIIFTSDDIITELKRILKRDFNISAQEIDDIVNSYMLFLHITETTEKINAVVDDPKDNIILECAVSCNADIIISGDKHLLNLKEYAGIKILSPSEFLDTFN